MFDWPILFRCLLGSYFEKQHLPGAFALVEADAAEQAASLLPDKHAAIVTSCSNMACPKQWSRRDPARERGYTIVRKYSEGSQDWVEARLPVVSGALVS